MRPWAFVALVACGRVDFDPRGPTGPASPMLRAAEQDTCVLWSDGALKCWGTNTSGELGLGDTTARSTVPGTMGDALPFVDLGTGRTALELCNGGVHHVCAVLDNHSVKCWGENGSGELGLGDTNNRGDEPGEMGDALPKVDLGTGRTARSVTCGWHHSCAILDDGSVKCWGTSVALGVGAITTLGDAPGEMGDALPTVDLGTVRTAKMIRAGNDYTCAILDDDSLKCWGSNAGKLGLGDMTDRGGMPGQMGDNLPAVDLGTGRTARWVSCGDSQTCAVLDNNELKCWGSNDYGQLGRDDTMARGGAPGQMGDALPAIQLGGPVVVVETRASRVSAVLADGTLKSWGSNAYGRLGLGDTNNRGGNAGDMEALPPNDLGTQVTATSVTTGNAHTCVLTSTGEVKCFGAAWADGYSQPDPNGCCYGDQPGEMGDALPFVALGH